MINCGVSAPRAPLVEIPSPHFDLEQTLASGQVFHWQREGTGFSGLIGSRPVQVEQTESGLRVTPGMEAEAAHYFALDHPLPEIEATFPDDEPMRVAGAYCRGLRIMRQEPWECLATFITSALKQVPHIRQISLTLRAAHGEPVAGSEINAYPTPEKLAAAGETALREAKLGFRAKNLAGAARMVADGRIDLGQLRRLPTSEARAELCRLPGVGEKVANCVLLFAYERLEAFPIDVWIERVLRELYFARKRNVTSRRLRDFAQNHFGPYAGYAQQYLFHHARHTLGRRPARA